MIADVIAVAVKIVSDTSHILPSDVVDEPATLSAAGLAPPVAESSSEIVLEEICHELPLDVRMSPLISIALPSDLVLTIVLPVTIQRELADVTTLLATMKGKSDDTLLARKDHVLLLEVRMLLVALIAKTEVNEDVDKLHCTTVHKLLSLVERFP